ncbi:AraC family transcriptional regulator [Cytobacillus sp. Hm23]
MRVLDISYIPPSRRLREFIDCYWIWESNNGNQQIKLPRVLPSINIEMIFHYQSPTIFINHKKIPSKLPDAHVVGIQKSYIDLHATGKIGMIAVRFLPGSFHHFCNETMANFTNNLNSITEIWGKLGDELQYQIKDSSTLKQKVEIIEKYLLLLLNYYHKDTDHQKIQAYVIDKLTYPSSITTIKNLCNEINVSERQLQRIFHESIGVSPTFYRKLSTFAETSQKICLYEGQKYLDIIHEGGYYDQSHFINVFKQFSGLSPLSVLTKEFMSYFYNTKTPHASKICTN